MEHEVFCPSWEVNLDIQMSMGPYIKLLPIVRCSHIGDSKDILKKKLELQNHGTWKYRVYIIVILAYTDLMIVY